MCEFSSIILANTRRKNAGELSLGKFFQRSSCQNLPKIRALHFYVNTLYTDLINRKKEWTLAGIFADEGISGTQTKKRTEFNRMIRMCRNKKIDLVITKSISRFARNTVDCLEYVRQLKDLGIGVIFEKENINTMTI